jgi:hypothetical protein
MTVSPEGSGIWAGLYRHHACLAGRPGRRELRPAHPGPPRIIHGRAAAPAPRRPGPPGPVPGADRVRPPRRGSRDRPGGHQLGPHRALELLGVPARSSMLWPIAACPRPPTWPRHTGRRAATESAQLCPDEFETPTGTFASQTPSPGVSAGGGGVDATRAQPPCCWSVPIA